MEGEKFNSKSHGKEKKRRKSVDCPLWVRSKVRPQVKEFKYFRDLFTREGKMECEIDRQTGIGSAILKLNQSVVVMRVSRCKTKLLVYISV